MNSYHLKRICAVIAVIGAVSLALMAGAFWAGARINTTRSIPVGLYWTSNAPVEKDAYVLFCPPQNDIFETAKKRGYIGAGFCPGGYGYMMKRILAAKNDFVSTTAEGLRVNGDLLPLSTPRTMDLAGRALPRFEFPRHALADDELLLMSDVSATSFDGRYFGPINRSQVITVIAPVITW
jgi:conjugative transfer signal peptidase TraF